MIVKMYGEDYEQDVRPLIKAFFPEEEICYLHTDDAEPLSDTETDAGLLLRLFKERYEIEFTLSGQTYRAQDTPKEMTRRDYRNHLHRSLYTLFAHATGRTLPWGTLTGIRPTKQMLAMLEEKKPKEKILDFFKTEYLCSPEMAELGFTVAKKEQQLLSGVSDKDSYSIYIGIPFCPSTCLYCSFTSYSAKQYASYIEPYLEALEKEIDYAATCYPDKKPITVYIGGGTPTTLSAEQLSRLIQKIKAAFPMERVREFTVEAGRPDSITADKLSVLMAEGVTRISVNPQSMNQKTLDIIGRKHTVEQVYEAFALARNAGFTNINMDLIIGLTKETPSDVKETLQQVKTLSPDSLTVHTLAIKRAARLNQEKEQYKGKEAKDVTEMMRLCKEFTAVNGYMPYYLYRQKNMAENLENIGYAKEGKEGLYNVLIMEERHTILALGAGGSSKILFREGDRLERIENVKSVKDYITRIDEMIMRKKQFFSEHQEELL